jgi:hypothetical protein
MSSRTLAATLFGVGGLWMIAKMLGELGILFADFGNGDAGDSHRLRGFGLYALVRTAVGLALILGRRRLAAAVAPDQEVEVPAESALLDVGFRLAGVFVLAEGLELVLWRTAGHPATELLRVDWTQAAPGLALAAFGVALLLGARGLSGLLSRVRAAP